MTNWYLTQGEIDFIIFAGGIPLALAIWAWMYANGWGIR